VDAGDRAGQGGRGAAPGLPAAGAADRHAAARPRDRPAAGLEPEMKTSRGPLPLEEVIAIFTQSMSGKSYHSPEDAWIVQVIVVVAWCGGAATQNSVFE